jgi:CHAT domain/Phage integrase family
VALRAGAFVRAHLGPARLLEPPATAPDSLRILLVICRPRGEHDVPFRSVASQLVRLSADVRATLQLDVLRPPTFVRLAQVLRDAKAQAVPYQVVHFDGHGMWADLSKVAGRGELSPLHYGDRRSGAHGYLLFEQPEDPDNVEFVDGPRLGDLLVETDVPVLVLNACRSAHAELTTRPDEATELGTTTKVTATAGKAQSPVHGTAGSIADAHGRVRAYGSLAQEVIDAGVAGVVAMRYVVYVATAAQFVGELYASLLAGQELGVAVSRGRKHLADRPIRQVGLKPVNLQDWPVPVIYQAGPVTLVPPAVEGERQIVLDVEAAGRERQRLELGMPAGPDVGFFGRDETLLALDRAFDTQQVVLLHAWAGAGKTTTAVEFARWYQFTGGLTFPRGDGRLLFTSFQQHTPLAQVLDEVGQAFAGDLEAAGIRWLVLDDAQRRRLALQVLEQVPVLWVWDNVEPIAGFPTGVSSAWTDAEQAELRGFLRELQHTKAKVLLTSRRDERAWLGDLPRRVELPPMPMADRLQLVRAVANRHGQRQTHVDDWRPLLAFSQGNPLTLTVLVGQALREGIRSKEQMEAGPGQTSETIRSRLPGRRLTLGTIHDALWRLEMAGLAAREDADNGQPPRWSPTAPPRDDSLDHLQLRGPHDLRHTFSTWLEDAGIPARVIDELMGHAGSHRGGEGSMIGLRYRHTTLEMEARVVAAIEQRLATSLAVAAQVKS